MFAWCDKKHTLFFSSLGPPSFPSQFTLCTMCSKWQMSLGLGLGSPVCSLELDKYFLLWLGPKILADRRLLLLLLSVKSVSSALGHFCWRNHQMLYFPHYSHICSPNISLKSFTFIGVMSFHTGGLMFPFLGHSLYLIWHNTCWSIGIQYWNLACGTTFRLDASSSCPSSSRCGLNNIIQCRDLLNCSSLLSHTNTSSEPFCDTCWNIHTHHICPSN